MEVTEQPPQEAIKFAKNGQNPHLPERQYHSAALDLFADRRYSGRDWEIRPNQQVTIPTGIQCELPENMCGLILNRSSMVRNNKLIIATGTSLLDPDYRGNIAVDMYNYGTRTVYLKEHERFAQLLLLNYVSKPLIAEVAPEELTDTERGAGGFGSTGRFNSR